MATLVSPVSSYLNVFTAEKNSADRRKFSLESSSSSLIGNARIIRIIPSKPKAYKRISCVRAHARDTEYTLRKFSLEAFSKGNAFKVIAGLQNFNVENVASVVSAAEKGGATHVDIACDPELVKMALSLTSLPICVSAVDPNSFVPAVEAGAHMVELGNYDSFYSGGRTFSAEEVLQLTRATRALLPDIVLSVTVPHTLPLDEQVRLAEELEASGADIIQTEGGTASAPVHSGVHGLVEKAAPTLAAAYSISRAVSIPVMCASGLSAVTAPMALAAGAAGVGVGSAVSRLNEEIAMVAAVRSIADSIKLPVKSSWSTRLPLLTK